MRMAGQSTRVDFPEAIDLSDHRKGEKEVNPSSETSLLGRSAPLPVKGVSKGLSFSVDSSVFVF